MTTLSSRPTASSTRTFSEAEVASIHARLKVVHSELLAAPEALSFVVGTGALVTDVRLTPKNRASLLDRLEQLMMYFD